MFSQKQAMSFIVFNQQLIAKSAFQANFSNRSFYYGDGFFETILYKSGKFPFSKWHVERIINSFQLLHLKFENEFTLQSLESDLLQLIVANKVSNEDIVVKINFYRNGESGYNPTTTAYSWLAELKQMPIWKDKISLCFYTEEKKSAGKISQLKSTNALIYVMAAQFAAQQIKDEAIVFNTNNQVADCTNSNLFIIHQSKMYTPPLTDGGVDGVARKMLMNNFEVEEKSLTANDIINADEVFLTNAVRLIQPVFQVDDKKYSSVQTTTLQNKLMVLIN